MQTPCSPTAPAARRDMPEDGFHGMLPGLPQGRRPANAGGGDQEVLDPGDGEATMRPGLLQASLRRALVRGRFSKKHRVIKAYLGPLGGSASRKDVGKGGGDAADFDARALRSRAVC